MSRAIIELTLELAQYFRTEGGIAWQYLKVESIPPMSSAFFHGAGGRALELSVAKFADGIIAGLKGRINAMDEAAAKIVRDREAAIRAVQEQQAAAAKAAAKSKEDEKKRKEEEAQKEAKAKAEKEAKEKPPEKKDPKKK